jgi:hypothetical protein
MHGSIVNLPERGKRRPIYSVVELAISRHASGEARFARSHRIALPRDGERRGARTPHMAGEQREVADGIDGFRALGAVVDPHGPADETGFRAPVEYGSSVKLFLADTRDFADTVGRIIFEVLLERIEPAGVALNILPVDKAMAHQNVRDSV